MARKSGSMRIVLRHGILGGLVAGVLFALVEVLLTGWVLGAPYYEPLRVISALVEPQTLQAGYPTQQAVVLGTVVHAFFSALYGVVFLFLLAQGRQIAAPTSLLMMYGMLYSLLLWAVNFLIVGLFLSPVFSALGPYLASFTLSHAVYGLTLGAYTALVRPGFGRLPGR